MNIDKWYRLRGWISIIFSGLGFGFVVGLIILIKINDESGFKYLIGFTILGLILGILIAYLTDRRTPEWFIPEYRSPDLDNFQDRYLDKEKDNKLIDLLIELTDEELITAFAYQYYDLLPYTRTEIIKEINSRQISYIMIEDIYERRVKYFRRNGNGCPRCGFKRYTPGELYDENNCIIFNYSQLRDDPNLFVNRLKKFFGMYNDRYISKLELRDYLKQN